MNMTGKTLLVAAMTAAVVLLGGCSSTPSVGVLDVNKVMTESPKVKQFQEQLTQKGKELSEQLEKEKASLSPEEFQKKQETVYGDFAKTKQDMEGQIDTSMKQALEQVAKDKKMGVILYKNTVAQGGTDVTDDVIKKMQ